MVKAGFLESALSLLEAYWHKMTSKGVFQEYNFRQATSDDHDAIRRCLLLLRESERQPFSLPGENDDDAIARCIKSSCNYACNFGDQLIALAQILLPSRLTLADTSAALMLLWVEEKFRRQKVATAFLDYLTEESRKHGARTLALCVSETNDTAKSFYEHVGFKPTSICMRKSL